MLSVVKFKESSSCEMLGRDLFLLGGFLGVLKEDLNKGILDCTEDRIKRLTIPSRSS